MHADCTSFVCKRLKKVEASKLDMYDCEKTSRKQVICAKVYLKYLNGVSASR